MRFLIDMPLSPEIALWLRTIGHDSIHASDAGMARASDGEILQQARSERRTVITADLDYPRLMALAHSDAPGIILLRGGDYSERESIERLTRVLESIPEWVLQRSIVVVEKHRIRRRSLPLDPSAAS